MEHLIEISQAKVARTKLKWKRFLFDEIEWEWRLNGVIGARGTGKTTLLLQRLKENQSKSIYISLDEFHFTETRLYTTIDSFRKLGYKYFFLDKVHKYEGWAREIKNLHDTFNDIHITFTGSSILEVMKQEVDLSRRAVIYYLPELSFREYLILSGVLSSEKVTLETLLESHSEIVQSLPQDFRPLTHFQHYLKLGAYPFFLESSSLYHHKLLQVVKLIIESDLQFIQGYDPRNAKKIFQLLYNLAQNVPFKPNISKLSEKIGITRNTLIHYFHYLEKAALVHLLYQEGASISSLQKPEKILLRNPNLAYTISPNTINKGSLRESFFISQLSVSHQVALHNKADFVVDEHFVFEIGGKNKGQRQITDTENSFLVKDDIESGYLNNIPLWMFGLLY